MSAIWEEFFSTDHASYRMGRLRIFPLTLSECAEIPLTRAPFPHLLNEKPRVSRTELFKHLERGGFPGIFSVRNESSRKDFFQDWLSLTIERDLHQFPGVSVDTDLAYEVLYRLPLLAEPSISNIAKAVKKDSRAVQKILKLLTTLFVVHSLSPFREGTGKPLFFLCDVGLASYLGADLERQLWTWLIHEQLAQRTYRNDQDHRLTYYRSPKGKFIHLVVENLKQKQITALKIFSTERVDLREFEILKAFKERVQSQYQETSLNAWGPFSKDRWENKIDIHAWESLA